MRLKLVVPSLVVAGILGGCDSFLKESLPPCPRGVDLHLKYTNYLNNPNKVDAFLDQVHCARVYLYDSDGNFKGQYDVTNTNVISVDLPAGNYHAVSLCGVGCQQADFLVNHPDNTNHHYTSLEAYLAGSRADNQTANNLHPFFHGVGDFTILEKDYQHIVCEIGLTKNTNTIRVELEHTDGSAVNPGGFDCYVTADNAATDYENNLIPSGTKFTYKPYTAGNVNGNPNKIFAEISTGRLTKNLDATLHVYSKVTQETTTFKIIPAANVSYENEVAAGMNNISWQQYLDFRDFWTFTIKVAPDGKVIGQEFNINDWSVRDNNFDL
ncbi:MAG: FimB/Mfa2 family fimbrial subunit [Muribaculaceae bacterium]|nr:FimB/Mfa2 family fimbrial subunit [Muribaculaceae bacterium]